MFLATTALNEFWDTNQKILFLGDHCKLFDSKEENISLESHTMPPFWHSSVQVEDAITVCKLIYQKFLPLLTDQLNILHGEEQSEHYYHIILGNWLEGYIQQYYDKFYSIQKVLDTCGVAKEKLFTYTLNSHRDYIPSEIYDYFEATVTDEYALQLYSYVIRFLQIPHSDKALKQPIDNKRPIVKKFRSNVSRVIRSSIFKMTYLINSILQDQQILISALVFKENSFFNHLKLWIMSKAKIVIDDFSYQRLAHHKTDFTKRKEISTFLQNNHYESLFETFLSTRIAYDLPVIFLENFQNFKNTLPLKSFDKTAMLITMNNLHMNMKYKFVLAENYQRVKHIAIQHGSGYGIDFYNNPEAYETSVSDKFFTWGWRRNDKTIPLPQPKNNIRYECTQQTILFIINEMPRYVYRLHFYPMSNQYLRSLNSAMNFFDQIQDHTHILVRSYPLHALKWFTNERLEEKFPDLKFDDFKTSYNARLKEAKIIISNHLGTTFLEALEANIPILIFIDPDIYTFSAETKIYIQALENANIVHYSASSAASFFNSISHDIHAWWYAEETQKSIKLFNQHYIFTSSDWAQEWVNAFNTVLEH